MAWPRQFGLYSQCSDCWWNGDAYTLCTYDNICVTISIIWAIMYCTRICLYIYYVSEVIIDIFITYIEFYSQLLYVMIVKSRERKRVLYQFWITDSLFRESTGFLSIPLIMMTSSNGNIFRVTGPLCGEFTGPGEFPAQRPVTRSFDVFFDLRPNKRLSKQPRGWWFDTSSWSLWRQCNVTGQ